MCPGYDTKQSDVEVPVMLGIWGMWSIPSLPLLPGPLWSGMVAPDRALSIAYLCQTELFELELFDQTEELEIEMFLTIKLYTYI